MTAEEFNMTLPIKLRVMDDKSLFFAEAYLKHRIAILDFPGSLTPNQVNQITQQLLK